jgi:tripartite ATP-independent transporter DctM subunit
MWRLIDMGPALTTLLMFLGLLVGLAMGHPLAFVLGGLGVIFGLIGWGPAALGMFANRIYAVMDNYILVAGPLFIFMAQLLDRSGIAEGLFDTMRLWFRSLRGGIAVAVIVVSTLFAACTGIVGASVVSMGVLSLPLMLKYKYDKRLATGVICSGGVLGILIPPSIMLIFMADQAALSVGKLFAGAIIPGLILSSLYIGYILFRCWRHPDHGPAIPPEEIEDVSLTQLIGMTLKTLVPPFVLIIGVLGSIFTGICTPTEASAAGATLAFFMMIAYRRFSWRALYDSVIQTAKITSMAYLIICGASIFSAVFLGIGGGQVIGKFILGLGIGKWGTFIIMMLIVFVLGGFIDWIGIVYIVFPIFLPIAESLGFDRVWFVVVMAVMLQDSFLTPPFGYALFYLRGISPPEVTTSDIYWGALPFWELMELGLVICVLFPQTVTWLPSILVKGG